jgi:hypothetical protein
LRLVYTQLKPILRLWVTYVQRPHCKIFWQIFFHFEKTFYLSLLQRWSKIQEPILQSWVTTPAL